MAGKHPESQKTRLSPLVLRLRAPNPGPMTLTGTNSYIVGSGARREVAVIDPGPDIPEHLEFLAASAVQMQGKIGMILVTHGHPDHFPGAARLSRMTGAPVAAYKDAHFPFDLPLEDGQEVRLGGFTLEAIFTPGHAADHLCYFLEQEKALFTGDLILGSGTVIVAPPKGSMRHYLESLSRLEREWGQVEMLYGGHGPEVKEPATKIKEYLSHRKSRQDQLLKVLEAGAATVPEMVSQIYRDVDKNLWPAAARQVTAYLIMLEEQGRLKVGAERVATKDEAALLSLEGIVDPVAAAELGIQPEPEKIRSYSLEKG